MANYIQMVDTAETPKTTVSSSYSTAPSTPQSRFPVFLEPPHRAGLTNLGHTCYANCVVQTLFANDEIRYLILSWRPPVERDPAVTCVMALQALFANMRFEAHTTASTYAFFTAFRLACTTKAYDFDTQEDPNEFMGHLTDIIVQGLSKGSCPLITKVSFSPPSIKTEKSLLGSELAKQFEQLLSGEGATLVFIPAQPDKQLTHCITHHKRCGVFGDQWLRVPTGFCRPYPKTDDVVNSPKNLKNWTLDKIIGYDGKNGNGELFREIHLMGDTFENLYDAISEFRFQTGDQAASDRKEWWVLRSPRVWHFTLPCAAYDKEESWKNGRAVRLPLSLNLDHLNVARRGASLPAVEAEMSRRRELKRLQAWYRGFPVGPRQALTYTQVLNMTETVASDLKAELKAYGGDTTIADKLSHYVKAALREVEGVSRRALERRTELVSAVPGEEKTGVRLQSVWIHSGSATTSGHYWCLMRDGSNWISLNDTDVKIVPESQAMAILDSVFFDNNQQCVYSAFYEDVEESERFRQQLLSALADEDKEECPSNLSSDDEKLRFIEFRSLPEEQRMQIEARSESSTAFVNQWNDIARALAVAGQYLDELLSLFDQIRVMFPHLSEVFALVSYETVASIPVQAVLDAIAEVPTSALALNDALFLWVNALYNIAYQSGLPMIATHNVGSAVFHTVATDLYLSKRFQDMMPTIFAQITEKNVIYLNLLLDQADAEGCVRLKDLSKFQPHCAVLPNNVLTIRWDLLLDQRVVFEEAYAVRERALCTAKGEGMDSAFCLLTSAYLTCLDCYRLPDEIATDLGRWTSLWIQVLRSMDLQPTNTLSLAFSTILRILYPVAFVLAHKHGVLFIIDGTPYPTIKDLWQDPRNPFSRYSAHVFQKNEGTTANILRYLTVLGSGSRAEEAHCLEGVIAFTKQQVAAVTAQPRSNTLAVDNEPEIKKIQDLCEQYFSPQSEATPNQIALWAGYNFC
eukprot:Blabericola_migrator_1__4122@NODE_2258_length_3044_cov_77_428284_g1422_i0_p1_GENE_NODE_2258_length_3044_cov_77_428284_g1422_i0NODE_2258_length_3044_cov_77_428284_g1422_i0_p1_ORF_typecomplete_len994_score148_22UCH/PF00443_29/5_6e30UCH_1/PF13423_6/0_069UCH_1/PF13423_6/0_62_NODE_2258_length_3044_cov_77_428284_g1422_i0632981